MPKHPIELKEKSRSLRSKGYSVKEIARKLKVSQSTSSLWVRDVELGARARKRLDKRHLLPYYKSAIRWRKKREEEERLIHLSVVETVEKLRQDVEHMKLYCSLLYWCEGGKGYYESVRFVNSDPILIKTFLILFRNSFHVDEGKFRVLMYLHSYHNERVQKEFWSNLTKIPKTQFNKTFLKPNTKKRIRNNYPGCVAISYHDRKVARMLRAIYKAFSERMGA